MRQLERSPADQLRDRAAANARVQTSMLVFVLPTVTRSRCKFGLNFRRAMPVTLVPTPPKYLALPRVVTRLPMLAVCRKLRSAAPSQPQTFNSLLCQ